MSRSGVPPGYGSVEMPYRHPRELLDAAAALPLERVDVGGGVFEVSGLAPAVIFDGDGPAAFEASIETREE